MLFKKNSFHHAKKISLKEGIHRLEDITEPTETEDINPVTSAVYTTRNLGKKLITKC